jgi:hypothetical protein
LGGIAIGDYFQPHALGEGYDAIEGLLHGDFPPTAVISLLVVKLLIWAISLGPGTLGGVLAPLLMMGAGQGAVESTLLAGARPLMWPLVSTGGVLAGVMRSPAHRYCKFARVDAQCCLPAAASECVHRDHAFSVLVMTRSILTEIVARCGFHIFRRLGRRYKRYFCGRSHGMRRCEHPRQRPVTPVQEDYFGHATQKCRSYPSVDENHGLLGLVTRAEISQCHKEAPNSTLTECEGSDCCGGDVTRETLKRPLAS